MPDAKKRRCPGFNQTATALESGAVHSTLAWYIHGMVWRSLKILIASIAVTSAKMAPGERLVHNGFPAVQTSQDLLVLEKIQPAGKKPMSGNAFLHGVKNWA
jgi:methionyl-tRNA formyltransferase